MIELKSDLHIHTTHSDGSMCPKEVLDLAKHKGLDVIAITDHDIVSGVEEAITYGKTIGMKVLSGIELSSFSTTSVHILGYNIDYKNKDLVQELDNLLEKRRERAKKIVDKLANYKVMVDFNNLPSINVGRSHIAKEIRNNGYVTTIQEAFDRYLAEGRLAYVPSSRLVPIKAVELVKKAGGKAVIAHPMQLLNSGKLELLIEGLLPYGLDGLEVYYPTHTEKDIEKLKSIAKKYNLFETGGSDFHGIYKNASLNMIGNIKCPLAKELNIFEQTFNKKHYKK